MRLGPSFRDEKYRRFLDAELGRWQRGWGQVYGVGPAHRDKVEKRPLKPPRRWWQWR